ncbi:guanine deaminase-like [Penaeus indicus]|uniref:guanine deaminase-like n=1 Tax=Penaeus indicus TaxID=29960 RepID=UPI00300D9B8D
MADLQVFTGTIVHSTDLEPMQILENMAVGVLDNKIVFVEPASELANLKTEFKIQDTKNITMTQSQFLMPGFVDTHIHAPQFPNNGIHLDLPLLDWLDNYTFPTEAKFADGEFARYVYGAAVDRLLRCGTTTASYFGSLHLEGTKILGDTVLARGQRALVGKVNMLMNCPSYYQEASIEDSLRETEEFILYIKNLNSELVLPIVTPRFAPTCPKEQMEGLAQLAAKHDCHIQSHICESQSEIDWVQELFPWSTSYANVYDTVGLLTDKTVMAHGVWLKDEEVALLKEHDTGVAHCPNSNISLKSGLCDVQRLLRAGLKIGLGTDCSGGYSPSILNSLRQAVLVSKALSTMTEGYESITLKEAFRLATLGGAKVVRMEDRIGNFEVGKEFDALLIDTEATGTPLDIFLEDKIEEKVEKFLYNGDDRNILQVYVAGKKLVDQTRRFSSVSP